MGRSSYYEEKYLVKALQIVGDAENTEDMEQSSTIQCTF
jgi:hypothetical protein